MSLNRSHAFSPTALEAKPIDFRTAQWRTLIVTMTCYLFFYTGRQTFGFAIPGIEKELGLQKDALGWISACMLWAYAAGQFINGNLGDKFGGRYMVSSGAVLSSLLNWVMSFGTSPLSLAFPWTMNGMAQSMGWAPGSRVLSSWWGVEERGKVYGLYLFSAGMASAVAFFTSTLILALGMDWRWIFRLPVLILGVMGVFYFILIRDTPEELGYPPVDGGRGESSKKEEYQGFSFWRRYRVVFQNRQFMIACISHSFQSVARYGLLIWVPVHFLGEAGKGGELGKWVLLSLPIGMGLGAFTGGWISDKVFKGKRSPVIIVSMLLAAVTSAGMYYASQNYLYSLFLLFLCGFLVYGPASVYCVLSPDIFPKGYVSTSMGVMNTFAYFFAGVAEPFIGWMIKTNGQNSLIIFPIVATACFFGGMIGFFIKK